MYSKGFLTITIVFMIFITLISFDYIQKLTTHIIQTKNKLTKIENLNFENVQTEINTDNFINNLLLKFAKEKNPNINPQNKKTIATQQINHYFSQIKKQNNYEENSDCELELKPILNIEKNFTLAKIFFNCGKQKYSLKKQDGEYLSEVILPNRYQSTLIFYEVIK